jgi:hypothetical protein
MKRTITSFTFALSFLSLLALVIVLYGSGGSMPTAQAKSDPPQCDLSSMKGSYGYTLTGFFSPSPGFNVPLGVVGSATVGEGGVVTNVDTLVVDGQVTENRTYSGTITLNPNNPCTGTIAFENGLKDNFVIVNGGEEIQFIQTAPMAPATSLQVVVTGAAKRQ